MPLPRLACLAAVAALLLLSAGGCGSAVDERPHTWSFISATIMQPSCATVNCHSAITAKSGVDLSSREAGYQSLVEAPAGKGTEGGLTYIVYKGYPQYSELVTRLNAVGSTRMPPDNPLPEADIVLIEKWISDGAPNN